MADPRIEIQSEQIFDEAMATDYKVFKAGVHIDSAQKPLFGTAFHLEYDPESLVYIKHESGNFFEQSAKPIYLVRQKDNKIYFGETLKKGDNLASGEGEIVSFYFKALKDSPGELKFSNTLLSGYSDERQIDLIADWKGTYLQSNILQNSHNSGFLFILLLIFLITCFCFLRFRRKRNKII